jgi:hypothetical protein
MVGGPRAHASTQTYCANFVDSKNSGSMPQNTIDRNSPNPSLDVHCEVTKCAYNEHRSCNASQIDIRTMEVNNGQIKTECATFKNRSGHSGGENSTQNSGQNIKGSPLGGAMDSNPEFGSSDPNFLNSSHNQFH